MLTPDTRSETMEWHHTFRNGEGEEIDLTVRRHNGTLPRCNKAGESGARCILMLYGGRHDLPCIFQNAASVLRDGEVVATNATVTGPRIGSLCERYEAALFDPSVLA